MTCISAMATSTAMTSGVRKCLRNIMVRRTLRNFGRMVFRKIDEMHGGPSSGTIRATFDLEGPDHKPFAEEVQQYTFSGDRNSRVIDCEFTFRGPRDRSSSATRKRARSRFALLPNWTRPQGPW